MGAYLNTKDGYVTYYGDLKHFTRIEKKNIQTNSGKRLLISCSTVFFVHLGTGGNHLHYSPNRLKLFANSLFLKLIKISCCRVYQAS